MEKYELLKKIGEGNLKAPKLQTGEATWRSKIAYLSKTYGIVYKAQNKATGTYVAIKKFKDSDDDEYVRKTALREIRILKQLKHDHIVDLLEVFREDNRIFLVFEQLNRTILDELQGRNDYSGIEPLEAKKIIWQMLKACDFMRSHNIVHRDFKPENMLLSRNGVLKICDFGFARQLTQADIKEGVALTEYVSTRWYRAPELLVGAPNYTHAVDVWAIGCIFVELVTGQALFTGDSDLEMIRLVIQMFHGSEKLTDSLKKTFERNNLFKNVQLPTKDETTDYDYEATLEAKLAFLGNNSAVSFARECLRMDPDQRPTAESLLEHDFFNDFRDWFEDEIQTLMEYDQTEMQQGANHSVLAGGKVRDNTLVQSMLLKSRTLAGHLENILGENQATGGTVKHSITASNQESNPFSQLNSKQKSKESSHSPDAPPCKSGTPIRQSRQVVNQKVLSNRNGANIDTMNAHSFKNSSFGSVIYDSNRKTLEHTASEENRHHLKQASSLSPTRPIPDMSRQETQQSLPGGANNFSNVWSNSTVVGGQTPSPTIQKQLPQFGGGQQTNSGGGSGASQVTPKPMMLHQHDESKKLYSVVIKEDPAEQFSPTFHAKKGFFQMPSNGAQPQATSSVTLNRNHEFMNQKQKTFRERERERLNNESQNSRGRSVTKININFNGDGNSSYPMSSSGTNLNALTGAVQTGSPRSGDDNKFYGTKLYTSNSSAISGIQTKKTLQTTNSTSNLEAHNGGQAGSMTKGAYYPTMRQRQARDNQMLLGLSTIQSNQYIDLQSGVTGIGYQHPAGSTITKTQPMSKVSLPSQSLNFPSFEENNNHLSSLIQLHNSSNTNLLTSQKSIQQQSTGLGISPKGIHQQQQLLAPSSSSYQFPLQALGQGLTSSQNPSKEQPRLKAMMIRNQSSLSTSPLGHSLSKPIGTSVGSKQYNSTLNSQQNPGAPPTSSHGNPGLNENQNIANQKNSSLDGMVSGPLPKPNVKIIDLQHNLLPFDSGIQGVGQLSSNSGAIASNTGQQIISDSGVRIDAQSLKNQLKQGKKEASNMIMSQQQHYLLQQIHNGTSTGHHHQLPQSSHNGLVSKQNLLITPKTPNDIYGFSHKANLNQIFDKGSGQSRSKIMSRHTTPFHQSFGAPGKLTAGGGGSNPKLSTIHQLIAENQSTSNSNLGGNIMLSHGTSSVPGGNRPGINSSGAVIKKNGSMGLTPGIGSYIDYNHHHHMSSKLQPDYKGQQSIASLGQSGTLTASHQHQQQILLAASTVSGAHPGSSGVIGYSKAGGLAGSSSVGAAYGQNNSGSHINKLSPTAGSRLSSGVSPNFIGK